MVEAIGDAAVFYKIGLQLFPLGGAALARALVAAGKQVFLDFKYFDIGATVEKATRSATQLGAHLLTVHAERATVAAAVAGRGGDPTLKILAVTVLTSMDEAAVSEMGWTGSVRDLVMKRAAIAFEEGADGVVASPEEAGALRAAFGPDKLIVTPGVRPAGAALNDQKRVATPEAAIKAGASHLVVGRPVTAADDPAAAAAAIVSGIADARA